MASDLDRHGVVDALGRFVGGQAQARDRIAANTMAQLRRLWAQVGAPTDQAAVEAFVAAALTLIQAGQAQTANVTAAYLRNQLANTPGVTMPRATLLELPDTLRNIRDPKSPYRRPFEQWRRDLGKRVDSGVAHDRALQRLMVMVDADLTMAMREGSRMAVADVPEVTGMRRIIRPELSRGGTCGLCIAAADRIYSVRLLMPMHARCNCETAPVTATHDPGLRLNEDDFALLYGSAGGSTAGRDLKRTRFRVAQHGEYGPVLVRPDDHFRGPGDLAA